MDSIGHWVARESLHDLIRRGKGLRPNLEIAPRTIQIFDAYFASSSFKDPILCQGLSSLRKKDPQASFPWPDEILRKTHACDDLAEIGIPQGGAISCYVTNVVPNEADQAIDRLSHRSRGAPHYLLLKAHHGRQTERTQQHRGRIGLRTHTATSHRSSSAS